MDGYSEGMKQNEDEDNTDIPRRIRKAASRSRGRSRTRTRSGSNYGHEAKAIPPLIRLETLDSTAVRTTIVCTYMTLFVSIALGVVSQFGHHEDSASFAIEKCPQGQETVFQQGQGCFVNVGNRSLWAGMTQRIASGLGEFHERLKFDTKSGHVSLQLTHRSQLFRSASEYEDTSDGVAFKDAFKGSDLKSEITGWTELVRSDLHEDVDLSCIQEKPCHFDEQVFAEESVRGTGKLHNFLVTTYFENRGLEEITSVSNNAEFEYVFVHARFRAFVIGIRGSFCLLTLLLLWAWVNRINAHYQSDDLDANTCSRYKRCCVDSDYCSTWLPQRRWIFWLVVSLFWWQNPLFVVDSLMSGSNIGFHVLVQSVGDVAWSTIFALLILLVGGLRRPHPYCSFECGFYIPKLLFASALSAVSICQRIVRTFELKAGYGNAVFQEEEKVNVLIADFLLGIASIALHIWWIVWFLVTLYQTREALMLLPYFRTRYQRLTFRFVVWQSLTVILYILIYNLVNLVRAFLNDSSGGGGGDELANAARVVRISTEDYQPISAFLVCSVYAYILLFCFLPPRKDDPQSALGKVGNAIANFLGIVTGSGTALHKRSFSLEMASWLFDFAWAAYYDPPSSIRICADQEWSLSQELTDSACGSLDNPPHDFKVDGFVYCRRTDTTAVVFRKDFQVVIAFRGTASKTNVLTDVKIARRAAELSSTSQNELSAIPGVRQVFPLIHQGFWDAYESVRQPLSNVVRSSIAQAGCKAVLYCTGHSLGGALATIAAYDMKEIVRDIREHS